MAEYNENAVITLPTATSGATGSAFDRIAINGSGLAVTAGAGDPGIGYAEDAYSASTTARTNTVAVRLHGSPGTRTVRVSGAVTKGANLYPDAAGKNSATVLGRPIAVALQAASGDGSEITALPLPVHGAEGVQRLINIVADSADHTNVATSTDLNAGFTFPANTLRAGDILRFREVVHIAGVTGTPTYTGRLLNGSTAVGTTGAVTVAANDVVILEGEITVRSVGATGEILASGTFNAGVPGTATSKAWSYGFNAGATIDTTAAQTFKPAGTWSAASTSNVARLKQFTLDLIRRGA